MGWTQEMQSQCLAFQASSLRFGRLRWWFCGLQLVGQPVLGFLRGDWVSTSPVLPAVPLLALTVLGCCGLLYRPGI